MHSSPTAEIQEIAALYSAGMLEAERASEFKQHMQSGCAVCAAELAAFEETATSIAFSALRKPPAGLEGRLMARVTSPCEAVRVLARGSDGSWLESGVPGVSLKQLFLDESTGNVTRLVKLEPGAVYPAHGHAGLEHCYVVEGDLVFHDHTLHSGDYEVAMPDTAHSTVSSVHGCLLLLITNQNDRVWA